MKITARPLTADAFSAFGDVLEGKGDGVQRHQFAARMQNLRSAARPNMTYMRVLPAGAPFCIKQLERHLYANQTFIPLNGTRHLIVVCSADADGNPILSTLVAFVADGSQSVNYHAGVWHAPRAPLSMPGEFIMFRWDDGGADDTETIDVAPAIDILGIRV